MRIPLVVAASLLAALPARALVVGKAPPEDFISRSRAEPTRLYALIVGATWCHACHALAAALTALEASSTTAAGRAAWDMVETDEYGRAKFSKLLSELQAPESEDLPSVLVIRDGDALGVSLAGNSIPKIESFLAEAEHQPSRYARPPAKSSMLCPGRKDWASYTLGISGYKSETDATTDDFGRKILVSFAPGGRRTPGRLFAPPRTKAAPGTESARAEDGVFFSASDPLAGSDAVLEDVARSTAALAALADAPGRDVRLVLTGHSGEEGMAVGYQTTPWFTDDPANTYRKEIMLSLQDVSDAVGRASRAGKRVRGLITTCFAGRYGEAFMPSPAAAGAAPSCAAFATLPDKTADGCYSNGLTLGVDYASKLIARRTCGASSQDGRVLHYAVAVTTTGHDIPMLSSEYFLLYGPGAAFLGRGDLAPAPPLSVQRYDLASGIRVYIDVISNQVLRAYQGDRMIDPPRLALLDCVGDDYSRAKLDREHLSAFYLRPHKNGSLVTECTPRVSLYWPADGGRARPSTTVYLEPQYGGWHPAVADSDFRKDFDATGPLITMEGMRPAARVLLTAVIPAFSDAGAEDDLGGRLDRLVEDLRPYDEPLAGALETMMAAQAGGVERGLPSDLAAVDSEEPLRHVLSPAAAKGAGRARPSGLNQVKSVDGVPGILGKAAVSAVSKSPDALDAPIALLEAPKLSTAAFEFKSQTPKPAVEATALVAAMFGNLAPPKNEYDPPLSRLAHLAAAAQAELALIEEAKTSPEARRLFAQLEAIKACEQGLY